MNKDFFIKSLKLLVAIVLGVFLTFYLFQFMGLMLGVVGAKNIFFVEIILIFILTFLCSFFLMSLGYVFQKISGFDDRHTIPFIASIGYLYFYGALLSKSFLWPLFLIATMFNYEKEGFEGMKADAFWIILPFSILVVFACFFKGFEFALRNKKSNQ